MKKISLGSWAFVFGPYANEPVPFDKCAKRLIEAGYDAIEVCGIQQHVTLKHYPTTESRAEVKTVLDDLGLARSGYACDQSDCDPSEASKKDAYLEKFARHLELCGDLEIKDIRVDTVAPPNKFNDAAEHEAAMGRVAEVFQAAAEKGKEAGVRLHWEFEPGFLFNKTSEILALHAKVAHENFDILFDSSHAYMSAVAGSRPFGEPEILPGGVSEMLDKLEGKIGALHVIDCDGTLHNDETSSHNPFTTGLIDIPALIPKLRAIPNLDIWTIDMCFWAGSWELADAQLAYLRRLLDVGEASQPASAEPSTPAETS